MGPVLRLAFVHDLLAQKSTDRRASLRWSFHGYQVPGAGDGGKVRVGQPAGQASLGRGPEGQRVLAPDDKRWSSQQ